MKFVGQILTDAERERVRNPYQINSGQKWTLQDTAALIHKGLETMKQDQAPELQLINENFKHM